LQHHVFTIAKVCEHYGVSNVIICPGSRSAPLVYAFTRNANFTCYSIIDERSAGFIALGIAQQIQKPVVLICTSGTAVVNFFPAIAEAYYQKIPLIILSADRPPEYLNQQDGQMIMQKGIFGKHVLGSHELLCFEENKIDYKLTERIVAQAIEESISEQGNGPVHINVPLREPLYDIPEFVSLPAIQARKSHSKGETAIPLPYFELFTSAWTKSKKKMLLIGGFPESKELHHLLELLSKKNDLLIITDVCSNQNEFCNVTNYDFLLKLLGNNVPEELTPDFILSLGGPMVSKSLYKWLKKIKVSFHFRLQSTPDPIDTYGNLTHLLEADVLAYLEAFSSLNTKSNDGDKVYFDTWKNLNGSTKKLLQNFHDKEIWCEPSVVNAIINFAPKESLLQVGNSSAIRWVSWIGFSNKNINIFSNRGTSGIDGCLSTAIGAALAQPEKKVFALIGDISFLYDEHALWSNSLPPNLKILVLNNKGGNIFNWIDGPSQHPNELSYFTTPQTRDLKFICESYKIQHTFINNYEGLKLFFENQSTFIEVIELSFENNHGLNSFLSIQI
jgi:2-succinyl-5-enolpyruvyl-6-hydroxy-3-cyclohexene-1-carboxylate synthase